jgi:phosphoribosylanthranilate isomerase
LLAGGLTADNVAAATAAPAVDTSSGVEREIGRVEPVWNMLY